MDKIQFVLGFDNFSRPCLYMIPALRSIPSGPRHIQQLVYSLERAVDMMPPGVETFAIFMSFKGSNYSNTTSPATGKLVIDILQHHYPERLGICHAIDRISPPKY